MAETKKIRVVALAREYNQGVSKFIEFLSKKGIEATPNTVLDDHALELIRAEFGSGLRVQKPVVPKTNVQDKSVTIEDVAKQKAIDEEQENEVTVKTNLYTPEFKILGKIDLGPKSTTPKSDQTDQSQTVPPKSEPEDGKPELQVKEEKPAAENSAVQKTDAVDSKIEEPVTEQMPEKQVEMPQERPMEQQKEKPLEKSQEMPQEKSQEKPQETSSREAPLPPVERLAGPKILGKIELPVHNSEPGKKGKRNRIAKNKVDIGQQIIESKRQRQASSQQQQGQGQNPHRDKKKNRQKPQPVIREQVSDEEVQKQIKDTLSKLTSKTAKTKSSKYRRDKREAIHEKMAEEQQNEMAESKILKVTEFVTANELATMMNVSVNKVIEACMNLGFMVSINQRLDAEALVIIAEEFGFKVEFVSASIQEAIETEEDLPEDLEPRSPVVTVMGHVDHGKTSLLDYIRKSNVIAGEAGGITQHIGAYSVKLESGRRVTFLDTPGHEAFTAMRARGAKITDVAIIIVAADDAVMPQTKEAISHAEAAGVPIVFAINKVDKPNAHPDKIKEELANMNYLVEEWGGKYQSQDISAKTGMGVDLLLEKVCLEADILDLKANPNRRAIGSVIESSLDKGRGYVATVLVQNGTMRVGDVMLAGTFSGRVKAMFNERGKKITEALPATPALVLGLNGAPQAGDTFNIMEDDRSAREIATKREQLQRIQGIRTQKHPTLEDIGRRIAIGNFRELNIIIKADVDGSIEALADSLLKLSNEEVQVNVIHKAVGQISESDVLLAAASNAVIVGFQVRPSNAARKVAENEEVEIRLYSIIYDAINEVKDAIEGMLAPETKEEVTCSAEVMEVFKISKVGTVAGCLVREGKLNRQSLVRIIRDGIVVYTGKLGSLRRFKDDVKEVTTGQDCGLNIENFNDVKVGDFIEGYVISEIARKL